MTSAMTSDLLWRSLIDCPRTSLPWAALGYRAGRRDGRHDVLRALGDDGHRAAAKVRTLAGTPNWAEVMETHQRPDYQPCSRRCGACSRCICSRSYWQRGGRPFLGVEAERARAAA